MMSIVIVAAPNISAKDTSDASNKQISFYVYKTAEGLYEFDKKRGNDKCETYFEFQYYSDGTYTYETATEVKKSTHLCYID